MQSKTSKIASPPEKTGSTIAPDDSMIPYAICFEDAPIGMAITSMNGKVLHLNKALLSLTGYSKEESSKINASSLYKNPQERERFIFRLRKEKKVKNFETEFVHKDGYSILISMTSVLISLGPEEALMTMVEDITESRRLGKELAINEQAIETSISAIAMSDLNGNLTYVNPACLRMWGYDEPSQVLDKAVGSFCHSWEDALKVLSEVQKKGKWVGELVAKRAEGTTFDVQLAANVVEGKEGDPIYLMSSFVDVSERKRAERELRESQHRLADIINFLPDATLVIDRSGTVIAWNRAMEEMTGVPSCEMIGKGNYAYAIPFYGERRPILVDLILSNHNVMGNHYKFIKREKDRIVVETDVPKVRGVKRVLWATAAPMLNMQGEIVGAIESIRDTTERRELEAQLIRAHKMESIGTLAGGIAHDFNNILTSIVGFTDMTIHELKDPNLIQNLGFVMKSCDRAKDLVSQILTFSRQSEQSKIPIEINGFIKDSIKLIRSLLPRTIDIRTRINGRPSTVISDPAHIYQILMNLCANAAHAMRENGGILEIAVEQIALRGQEESTANNLQAGNYVKISVSDTGHGISETIIDRIFDPFFTTKPVGEGTGLGLSVVYGIVRDHGGSIEVQSAPGKGSIFHVYLPAIDSITLPIEYWDEDIPQGRERILFVDDEDSIMQLGERMLRSLGYEVTAKSSSVEALDSFRFQPANFDLVVTDMTMPDMTGLNLSKEILRLRPDIPIILCTGYSELVNENTFKQYGIKSFIMKPFSRKNIAAMVRQALDQ